MPRLSRTIGRMAGGLSEEELEFLRSVLDWAREGKTDELAAVIDQGVPVNLTGASGDSLLILAAYHEHPDTVRMLLERGADPDRVNDRGQTALGAAVFRRSAESVTLLLDHGADPQAGERSAVEIATFFELDEMAALLAAASAGPDALRTAVDAGDVGALRDLLRENPALVTTLVPAPEIEPTSPLTYVGMARFYGYARHERTGELAQALLDAGADKDDETKNGSPLFCAASHGDADVVRVLLAAGADVDLTDSPNETALRAAAAFGFPAIVDQLVAAGARPRSIIEAAGIGDLAAYDIPAVSEFERACALRAASVNERLDVIDELLAAGTPIDAEVDGHPAIHWAKEQGRPRAVAHLTARGAAG